MLVVKPTNDLSDGMAISSQLIPYLLPSDYHTSTQSAFILHFLAFLILCAAPPLSSVVELPGVLRVGTCIDGISNAHGFELCIQRGVA